VPGEANGTVVYDILQGGILLANQYNGVIYRWSDSSNFWRTTVTTGSLIQTVKRVAGVDTIVASTTQSEQEFEINLSGNTITVNGDGELIHRVIDSFNSTATTIGIFLSSQTMTLHHGVVGNVMTMTVP